MPSHEHDLFYNFQPPAPRPSSLKLPTAKISSFVNRCVWLYHMCYSKDVWTSKWKVYSCQHDGTTFYSQYTLYLPNLPDSLPSKFPHLE